jgi:hypothetical protein
MVLNTIITFSSDRFNTPPEKDRRYRRYFSQEIGADGKEDRMNGKEGKPVEAQSSCAAFRHGFWSLEEEPAVCENCELYDEGFCFLEKEESAQTT